MDQSYEARRRRQIVGTYVHGGETPPEPPADATHAVTRDRVELFRGTEKECSQYIQHHQGQSNDWAMKYGGWAIAPIPGGGGIMRFTLTMQCDNAAFEEGEGRAAEIGRILFAAAERCTEGHTDVGLLLDANGYNVGRYELTEE